MDSNLSYVDYYENVIYMSIMKKLKILDQTLMFLYFVVAPR